MPGIFISYRREDSAPSAGRLYDHLVEHFGKEHVFRDIDTIAPGAEFTKVIQESIGKCDVLIVVIGRDWLRIKDIQGQRRLDNPDDLVKAEIREALSQNKRVIPVLVEGASMPVAADLPPEITALAGRNAIEISESRFNYDVGRLIEAIASTAELPALQPKAMKASVEHSHTEANPLGMLRGWVRSRWGKRGSILLAIVLGLWGTWTQREHIAALPGVKQVIVWLEQQPAPKPSPGKFNLAMAALGNDPSGDMRRLILDELKQFSGVAVLSPGEMIETQGGNSERV